MNQLLRAAAISSALVFISCASQTVFLQKLTVEGPQAKPPLFITHDNEQGELRIVPKVSVGNSQTLIGRADGHSLVHGSGAYIVDTVMVNGLPRHFERQGVNTIPFPGRNFRWEPPKVSLSLTADYMIASNIAVVFGASYSSGTSRNYGGGLGGVAFMFESKNLGARVDLGAQITSVSYDVSYVAIPPPHSISSRDREVEFFHDRGNTLYANAYGAFTLNTRVPGWPLQGVLQLAISRQTLVEIDRRSSVAEEAVVLQSNSFFILTPGVSITVARGVRLVGGVHLGDETELLEAHPGVLLVPFLQLEATF